MSQLEVLARAPSADLIAAATVKARLEQPDADDPLIASLITTASDLLLWGDGGLGRDAAFQQYREVPAGYGRQMLLLSRFPVDPDRVTVKVDGDIVTDYEVLDAAEGLLWRRAGWPWSGVTSPSWDSEHTPKLEVTYYAGWILPGQIESWPANKAKALGDWVRPSSPALSPLLFECTTAGTTHLDTEPTWPTTAGTTVADGTAVWTGRRVSELPETLQRYAYATVLWLYDDPPDGLISEGAVGIGNQQFSVGSVGHALPLSVRNGLGAYRRPY